MNEVIKKIRQDLKKNADNKVKESGKRFFKEPVKLHGLKTATVTKIGKAHHKTIKDKTKKEIFILCEELWRSGYLEESFIACGWSYALRRQYEPKDFKVFEKWVKSYVSNWASCDTFCNHTVGAFIELYPKHVNELKLWARSKKRWMRRAAAVSLIIPAKRGLFMKDIFDIADILLCDNDDLVQKGYGWMLKAASQSDTKQVFDYVMERKERMPRTALRYAIEKMPSTLKAQAMA